MRTANYTLVLAAITITILLFCPTDALAECTPASSPGVRICSPTQNGTVVYGIPVIGAEDFAPFIDFNSTPAPGARIVKVKAYDNNRKFFEGADFQTGATIGDDTLLNGFHNLAINAWDSNGNVYQGRVSFWIVGDGFPFSCPLPSAPGINFCGPPADAVLSRRDIKVAASATGQSERASDVPNPIRLYVDNKEWTTQTSRTLYTEAATSSQGDHKFTIVAWDLNGNTYVSNRTLTSAYSYDWQRCSPHGDCLVPGIGISPRPGRNEYVGNSFTIQASVEGNPLPITAMRAYIGNTVVASSTGPTISMPVTNVPNGTQALTLQAWDTAGAVYRVRYSINVNVPH